MSFKNASLAKANFSRALLLGAHFDDADLYDANFTNADLRGAFLTRSEAISAYTEELQARRGARVLARLAPQLECADLRGADLSGQILFTLTFSKAPHMGGSFNMVLATPGLAKAKVDAQTKLDRLGYVTRYSITDRARQRLKITDQNYKALLDEWSDIRPGWEMSEVMVRINGGRNPGDRYLVFGVLEGDELAAADEWQKAVYRRVLSQPALVGTSLGRTKLDSQFKLREWRKPLGDDNGPESCEAMTAPPPMLSVNFRLRPDGEQVDTE